MADKINDIVKNLLDGMHSISHADTIVGEPAKVGDATVIPVHRLRVGFVAGAVGAGGRAGEGKGKTGARAVGGTAQIDPVAVLAIGPDGRPRLLSVEGEAANTWQALLREAPDLVGKLVKKLADRVGSAALSKLAERQQATASATTPDELPAAAAPAELPEKK
jgi:uncharacterized spore protein YtfJ